MMKRMIGTVFAVCFLLCAVSAFGATKDPWKKPVSLDVRGDSLIDAMGKIFKDTGISYTVYHAIDGRIVTATFRNLNLRDAFNALIKAADVSYTITGNVVKVDPKQVKIEPQKTSPSSAGFEFGSLPAEKIEAKPKAAQALRIKLFAKVTVTENGKKPVVYSAYTGSTGADGVPMPLDINGQKLIENKIKYKMSVKDQIVDQESTQYTQEDIQLGASITPNIVKQQGSSKVISLTGNGHIRTELPISIDKQFQVAVPAAIGVPTKVAVGSADLGDKKADFEISAVVTLEPGMVPLPERDSRYATPGQPVDYGTYNGDIYSTGAHVFEFGGSHQTFSSGSGASSSGSSRNY